MSRESRWIVSLSQQSDEVLVSKGAAEVMLLVLPVVLKMVRSEVR